MNDMTAIERAKANLTANQNSSEEDPKVETQVSTSTPEPTIEKIFQVYKSTLANQRIAMPNGKLITVTGFKYITDNEEEIEFLDSEIKRGFPHLAKVGEVTSSDLDPMNALRKKFYAEFMAEQAAQGAPVLTDTEVQDLNPAGTSELAALAAGSTSAAQ